MPETEFDQTDIDNWTGGNRLSDFRRKLRQWHKRHGRILPWRKQRDPYTVWISEIMLQQTTVAAVIPYFQRFVKRFPTVQQLAAAEEEDVLRLWEGLGYYSRARNLHKTARIIAGELGGRFPTEAAALQKLPGIGRYTAGAIVSFAFDRPAPIVEANTLRLFCRLLGFEENPRSAAGQQRLWAFAGQLVPSRSPGRFNEALMDVGATICLAEQPRCDACPVRHFCRALAEGKTDVIPAPPSRPKILEVTEAAVVLRKNGRVLLRRCQPGERWAGLWDFLRLDVSSLWSGSPENSPPAESANHSAGARTVSETARHLEGELQQTTGLQVTVGEMFRELRHAVTRYRIRLLCFAGRSAGGRLKRAAGLKWVPVSELIKYPLSTTGRKIAGAVEKARLPLCAERRRRRE